MTPIRLPLADVGDVDLHHGHVDATDAVGQGDGGVRVGSRIHDHAVVFAIGFLELVNQAALMVRLVVIKLDFREIGF